MASSLLLKALDAIHGCTNIETGLTHPSDRKAATEMFVRLHQAGETLDADRIEDWARLNGWYPRDAKELGRLAADIGAGKKQTISDRPFWNPEILEILRNQRPQLWLTREES